MDKNELNFFFFGLIQVGSLNTGPQNAELGACAALVPTLAPALHWIICLFNKF